MSTVIFEATPFLSGLLEPQAYSHPCEKMEVVETHISWVVLTGRFAYKIKKPVNFGFLDFSTLEKRRHFCHEELRLNARKAPGTYLSVVPITGTIESPVMDGSGEPFEYAVKMKQFDQAQLYDRQLREGRLDCPKIDSLAEQIADLHRTVAVASQDDPYGTPDCIARWALENFEQLEQKLSDKSRLSRLYELKQWTVNRLSELHTFFEQRKAQGFVRECHGDLHLGNITDIADQVVLFDGIEFNSEIRWIDVLNELAFLFTDLEHRGHPQLAWRALNRYLEETGDYQGLPAFSFYRLYRILVRAKVDALRLGQQGLEAAQRESLECDIDIYLEQGEQAVRRTQAVLILTRGLSGCGKSYLSERMVSELGALRLRSDVERKRLFSLSAQEASGSSLGTGIYTPEASRMTFERLAEMAASLLRAGYHTIVDATFLAPELLAKFKALAAELKVPVKVLDIRAPVELLRSRINARAAQASDASEADLKVLEAQLAGYRPLNGPDSIAVDGTNPDFETLVTKILD